MPNRNIVIGTDDGRSREETLMGGMMTGMTTDLVVWTIVGVMIIFLIAAGAFLLLRQVTQPPTFAAPARGQFGRRISARSTRGNSARPLVIDPTAPDMLRASNADRDHVAAELQAHFSAGRLPMEDFEKRLTETLAAPTLGQLRHLVVCLVIG